MLLSFSFHKYCNQKVASLCGSVYISIYSNQQIFFPRKKVFLQSQYLNLLSVVISFDSKRSWVQFPLLLWEISLLISHNTPSSINQHQLNWLKSRHFSNDVSTTILCGTFLVYRHQRGCLSVINLWRQEISKVETWCMANRLTLNYSKTFQIILKSPKKQIVLAEYKIDLSCKTQFFRHYSWL